MEVRIQLENGEEHHIAGITLAEQTSQRVYIEDEDDGSRPPEEYSNAEIIEIIDSQSIGYVGENGETIVNEVSHAEQIDEETIELTLINSGTEQRTGDLDRGYAY